MTKSDVQTSLRLPEELRDRLTQAAADHGYGIGEEIRRRLEASFAGGTATADGKTSQVIHAFAWTAEIVGSSYLQWHADRFAFEIVKAAVNAAMDYYRPPGEPVSKVDEEKHLIDVLCNVGDPPDVIGRTFALMALTGWAKGASHA
jgi:hypothetical protein